MDTDRIRMIPLFQGLPLSDLRFLVRTLRPVEMEAEAILMRENEPGDSLFIILDGQVEIIKALGTPEERLLCLNGPGEHLGEISLLIPDGLHTATVRCHTRVQLLELSQESFNKLLMSRPTLAMEVLRILSMRLRESQDATIRELQRMNQELQRMNCEITHAYDQTLEGWARALEMRDDNTEGHVRRVADLTLRLGERLGISAEDLIHYRRGAMLHDIGKMSIPDGILLKPDRLTEEEREIMRRHPDYAMRMLSEIEFLRPALNIPYCHHEKWDGSGYPRRLKGEEIPYAARIFAIVDVWDALTSDRPYRKAMNRADALEYIRSQSGTHFDPRVVEEFVALCTETSCE